MTRYYEQGLPTSNYHGALSEVALGENNHIDKIFVDTSNEYGVRVIIKCWSEHDEESHWYSIRDHKGDVFVAKLNPPPDVEISDCQPVWDRRGVSPQH